MAHTQDRTDRRNPRPHCTAASAEVLWKFCGRIALQYVIVTCHERSYWRSAKQPIALLEQLERLIVRQGRDPCGYQDVIPLAQGRATATQSPTGRKRFAAADLSAHRSPPRTALTLWDRLP